MYAASLHPLRFLSSFLPPAQLFILLIAKYAVSGETNVSLLWTGDYDTLSKATMDSIVVVGNNLKALYWVGTLVYFLFLFIFSIYLNISLIFSIRAPHKWPLFPHKDF